jgi:hypothetical protein
MGLLDPQGLDAVIAAGCAACGCKRLVFKMYVDGRLPLMGGEPVGKLSWAYDGEAFCDGIFEITCAGCEARVFRAEVCPRCHAEGGLTTALAAENRWTVPKACPGCGNEEIAYFAMVPARTVYEGKRAEKARTHTEITDPGFHGYRASCKACGIFAEIRDRCMLCEAPAPLRDRA